MTLASSRPSKPHCDQCVAGGVRLSEATYRCSIDDPADGLPVMCVGDWAQEKMACLRAYVDISHAVRRKFLEGTGGATYVDLFSGPGRTRVRGTGITHDGGALEAARSAARTNTVFSSVHVADLCEEYAASTVARLRSLGVNATGSHGSAEDTVDSVVAKLGRYGLHLAFLDPFNLGSLPFTILEKLMAFDRMDLLIHVSLQDLQRNLPKHRKRLDDTTPLDRFAPGWRKVVSDDRVSHEEAMRRVYRHWCSLLEDHGMVVSETQLVKGDQGQYLYWLAFASRHDTAGRFWNAIRVAGTQRSLF